MSAAYREHFAQQLRLTILRLLAEASGYRANSSVLVSAAAAYGFDATRAQVRTELAWLHEQALVTVENPLPDLTVATATERGLDVAAGRAQVPGVARPAPGA